MMGAARSRSSLLVRVGERTCALDLPHVLEIMRRLPVDEVAHAPGFVLGLSLIRGEPTPVVSLASLFAGPGGSPTRFVLVRAGERRVALAVDEVIGAFELDAATLQALPPLAQNAATGSLEAVGALDEHLLFVLNSASIVPDEVWQKLVPLQL